MNEDNATPTESEFQSAFETEMGDATTPPVATATPPVDEDKKEEPPVVEEPKKEVEEPKVEEPKVEEPAKVETPEEQTAREADEAAKKSAEEQPKYATKDDVVEALREFNSETTGRLDMVKKTTDQVIEKIYPEGIDQNIYDTNGNVIKTAQDIVDKGLLKENGEPYNYDEAASFMLQAQQKVAKNMEELNDWAEKVAEKNVNLYEGNLRVMNKWGDTLAELTQQEREAIADAYMQTLTFDETNSYITEMKLTPEQYYDITLAPYTKLNTALEAQKKLEEEAKTQEQKVEQEERNGIPPRRGTSDTKSNTGDANLDALVDELKKP